MLSIAHAREIPFQYANRAGLTLRIRAYTTPSMPVKYASRYDLEIAKTPNDGFRWDYTVPDEPNIHYNHSYGFSCEKSFNNQKRVTIRATLHQYKTYDEKLIFKGLDLVPLNPANLEKTPFPGIGRSLDLKTPRTLTTPSGISVTLLAKGGNLMSFYNGNARALFIAIKTAPGQQKTVLPKSPLYKKFDKPVSIRLESLAPNFMVSSFVDNTSDMLAISFPDLYKVNHLDALTLIVRQRVELKTIPVAIEVPVERPAKK